MITRFLISLVCIAMFSVWAIPAQANYVSNARYRAMIKGLIASAPNVSDDFSFRDFRRVYSDTDGYDPIGERAKSALLEAAYVMDTATNADDLDTARMVYQRTIYTHLGHYGVVLEAMALAQANKKYGNYEWLSAIRRGIKADMLSRGDGKSAGTAYEIINADEEYALLNALPYRAQEKLIAGDDGTYYTTYLVESNATGQLSTLFIDSSLPMRVIQKETEATGKAFNLDFKGKAY